MSPESPARVQGLLKKNEAFASGYKGAPAMVDLRALQIQSKDGLIVLTCLDPRCVPEQYFGPDLQAGVIRNAGGRPSQDVVRSVTVLRSLIDVQYLLVVHHTDCGMTHLSNDQIAQEAKERTPDAKADVDRIGDYGCFTKDEFEETVRKDVLTLRAEKALQGMQILGFTFDINDGVIHPLDV